MEETSIGHWPCARWRHETAHLATRSMLALLTMPPVTAHMKAKAIPSRRWFWQREAQGTRGRLGRDWGSYKCCALERRSKSTEKSSGRRDNSAQGLVLHTQLSGNSRTNENRADQTRIWLKEIGAVGKIGSGEGLGLSACEQEARPWRRAGTWAQEEKAWTLAARTEEI
jgi:hypothetical protein